MREDFAAFILTHGRPDNVRTLSALQRSGYTGRAYLVVDDEDPTLDEYRSKYGQQVLTFSKAAIDASFDHYDLSPDRRGVVWARNATWQLARDVGARYSIQLDDDYTNFSYRRWGRRDGEMGYHGWKILSMDRVLDAMIAFLQDSGALTVCMSQGGDHLGGAEAPNAAYRLLRKAMNSFVCDVERPFTFVGRVNEDVNTYVTLGALGHLLTTHTALQLTQVQTQASEGGMTELYLDSGTYLKSFFTVLAAPSCVDIAPMGRTSRRLHHRVAWRYAVPKIIREAHRRE